MIGMRVIKPEQLAAELARAPFGHPVVGWPHQKPSPRPFLVRVRERDSGLDPARTADERAAALVRIGRFTVAANLELDFPGEMQRAITHRRSRTARSDIFRRRPG